MPDDPALTHLLTTLDTLAYVARMMHPARLPDLIAKLPDARPQPTESEQIQIAATYASQACAGLRAAPDADNPTLEAYRAMRQYSRALEALIPLVETNPQISRYFLEPGAQITPEPHPDCGLYQEGKEPCAKPELTQQGTQITLHSATSGSWFRYTLDGTEPTRTRGYVYCGVITNQPGIQVKAIAFKSGMADSAVTEGAVSTLNPTAAK